MFLSRLPIQQHQSDLMRQKLKVQSESSPARAKAIKLACLILISTLLGACWEKQELNVEPPVHPEYTLYGEVSYASTDLPVKDAMIRASMVEVYQGEYLEPVETLTDSLGHYEFTALYRGRYEIRVTKRLEWLFDGEVGIIEYADKEYNISIPESSE